MSRFALRVLGDFWLGDDSGREVKVASRKSQILLALLASNAGQWIYRDRVIRLLWSDRADAQARGSLRQELTNLRKWISTGSDRPIEIDGERLRLDLTQVDVDLYRFEHLIRSDDVEDFERAVAIFRGPLLGDLTVRDFASSAWLQQERDRLNALYIGVLDRLLARRLTDGALDRACAAAEAILAHNPLREDIHRQLMELYARQGRYTQALQQFQICQATLSRELNIQPEPATLWLFEQIGGSRVNFGREVADRGSVQSSLKAISLASAGGRADAAPRASAGLAIAILPFLAIGLEPATRYLAEGLSDELAASLAGVKSIAVVPPKTVTSLPEIATDVRRIARQLASRFVLQGNLRQSGKQISVTVQLVDGGTGMCCWAERYDRELDDFVEIRRDISLQIARTLKVQLLPEEAARIDKSPTAVPEAHRLFMMGRAYFRHPGGVTGMEVAREAFIKAARADPNYAEAHAGIAYCEASLLCRGDLRFQLAKILENCELALRLNPSLADAHAARGIAMYARGRLSEAEAALKEALRLDDDSYEAHFFAGRCARAQGLAEKALRHFERAAEIQPTCFRTPALAAEVCIMLGRHDEAMSFSRRCLNRCEAELKVSPNNVDAIAKGATSMARLGRLDQSRAWAKRAEEIGADNLVTNYSLALAHLLLGNDELAIARLQRVFSGPPAVFRVHADWFLHDQAFERLSDHPAVKELRQRIANLH